MAGKSLISRMSDECLMKGKPGSLYFGGYQAGMRKFTLAGKSIINKKLVAYKKANWYNSKDWPEMS